MDTSESARLRDLYDYAILDTPSEPNFDRIVRMTASIFRKPICTLSLVDEDRLWFKAQEGLDFHEMPRQPSFCHTAIGCDSVMVIPDARLDPRFSAFPFVVDAPHVRFYAGAPLTTPRGTRIGSLFVVDVEPDHDFAERQRAILTDMARITMELMEARSRELELAARTREIGHMARHDPLTGLGNRRQLAVVMNEAARSHGPDVEVAILYLDLDGFKAVNDAFGHAGGDRLLCQVADRLRMVAGPLDHVMRIGGDEFAVVRFGPDSLRSGRALAARLVEALAAPFMAEEREIRIGTSVGMAAGRGSTSTADALLVEADQALYRAKTEGRGRYCVFDSESAQWQHVEPRRAASRGR